MKLTEADFMQNTLAEFV